MKEMRLDKILASSGRWSRKEVKKLIREGRVLVDGKAAQTAEQKCDPELTELCVDGIPVSFCSHRYVMLHKPAGVLSATEDRRTATVLQLLPPNLQKLGLFPVGRLDKDTEGLLLMTDDGELAHCLLSPKRHVNKVYYVQTEGRLMEEDSAAFAAGMLLEDGMCCLPARLEILSSGEKSCAYVTLQEGKFHQVKRMLAARGKPVIYLKRLSMGPLQLDPALEKGAWRYLSESEQKSLLALKSTGKV